MLCRTQLLTERMPKISNKTSSVKVATISIQTKKDIMINMVMMYMVTGHVLMLPEVVNHIMDLVMDLLEISTVIATSSNTMPHYQLAVLHPLERR